MSSPHVGITLLGFAISAIGYMVIFQQSAPSRKSDTAPKNEAPDETTNLHPTPEQALNLIRRRRSIFPKQYTGGSVPRTVILEMLEAARWAPTHKLTQPWKFIIFETKEGKESIGRYNAEHYKQTSSKKNEFIEKKYHKKMKNASISSYVIAICVHVPQVSTNGKNTSKDGSAMKLNPEVEEICSTAMAVQNMHLVATAYNIGMYWSSSGIYETKSSRELINPSKLREFLGLEKYEVGGSMCICLGWLFVGEYEKEKGTKKWPKSQRTPCDEGDKFVWR